MPPIADPIRRLLEDLDDTALRYLCDQQEIPYGRTLAARRASLGTQYRGQANRLIHQLRRKDLIELLKSDWVTSEGREYSFTYLSRGNLEDLRLLAHAVYVEDWEPTEADEAPVESAPFKAFFFDEEELTEWEEEDSEEFSDSMDAATGAVSWADLSDDTLTEDEVSERPGYRSPEHERWLNAELRFEQSAVHSPRDYQAKAIKAALAGLDATQPKLLHIGTGGGKTFIANEVLVEHLRDSGQWALWIAKDWRLLLQAGRDLCRRHRSLHGRVRRLGGAHSLLAPLPEGPEPGAVVYTTLHSLGSRIPGLSRRRQAPSLIIWDECHWAELGSLGRALLRWALRNRTPVLGLTATPKPEDVSHFAPVFQMSFAELVKRGHLATPVVREPLQTHVEWEAERVGRNLDFTGDSLRELAASKERNRIIVNHYLERRREYGRTIVFACTIEHAVRLAKMLESQGIKALPVHSKLTSVENEEARRRFERGDVDVLTNVAMLTHGADFPEARTVFLCRPTLSDVLYAQMVGRAARRHEPSRKDRFNIVEFADLSAFHDDLVMAKTFFEGVPSLAEAPTPQETTVEQSLPRLDLTTSSPPEVHPPTVPRDGDQLQQPVPSPERQGLDVRSLLVGAVAAAALIALLAAILS